MTSDQAALFSPRIDLAIRVAAVGHALAVRKGTALPYIAHPVSVARLLERDGWSEDVVLAGYLHDVLEDLEPDDQRVRARFKSEFAALSASPEDGRGFCDAVAGFIAASFGPEVARLVESVTEERVDASGRPRPWIERKEEVIEHLKTAEANLAALKAADVAHNVRSILIDLDTWGTRVLGRFNAAPDRTLWYYDSVAKEVARRLEGHPTGLPALLAAGVEELSRRIG